MEKLIESSPIAPETSPTMPLDILQIQDILPHRYPFLLIDRVLEIERKKRIVAIKNVTVNEPCFTGHFPGNPIFPGVLIIEAIAQAGGALLLTEIPDRSTKMIVLTGVEKAKFRRPVVPGDQLRIELNLLKWRAMGPNMDNVYVLLEGKATAEGKLCCEVTLTSQLIPRPGAAKDGASKYGAE